MRRGRLLALVAVAALALAGALYLFARDWRPSASDYQFQGVDVSAANGAVDWTAVKAAGADFAYVRASSGTDRDPAYETNWNGIQDAGMRRGAVHVWSLCRLGVDQANTFNTTVPETDDALPAAVELDFESDCSDRPAPNVVIAELKAFISMVETHTKRPLLLAVSRSFESQYRVTGAIDRPVWSFGNFFPPDYAARPWRMWRATDIRRIDGISGPVNWDVVTK
jgi:lysozyme